MILQYFKLREQPFGMTPDPRYLYSSGTHREALASLLYGLESGAGFVTLTAMPGMGKTTLLFEVLRRLQDKTRTVFLFQSISDPVELLRAILIDLDVADVRGSAVELQAKLNEVLKDEVARGKRLVLVIDEAQNLDEPTLEAVRMLSNFETSREKLVQIILAGQLQLAEKLASPQLLQLRQRVAIYAHLKPLTLTETASYIQHRLKIAGLEGNESIFTPAAQLAIAKESHGIPRNINNLCFNALSLGYALSSKTIDVDMIREIVSDLDITRYLDVAKAPDDSIQASPYAVIEDRANQVDLAGKADQTGKADRTGIGRRTERASRSDQAERADAAEGADQDQQTARARPRFGVLGIAAAIGIIVLALGGVAAYKLRAQMARSPVAAESKLIPATTSNTDLAAQTVTQTAAAKRVKVREGQSLYAICTSNFGDCSPTLMKWIVDLNPSIRDPNHIESGEEISLPKIDVYSKSGKAEPATSGSMHKEMSPR